MIYLNQSMNTQRLDEMCKKIDVKPIKLDIDILNEYYKQIKSVHSKNADAVKKDLSRLKVFMRIDKTIDMCWSNNCGVLESYPINIVNYGENSVDIGKAIIIDSDEVLKDIKIPHLRNIMAFKYAYEEFGYTISKINSIFCDIGVTGINSSSILFERIKDLDKVYDSVKDLKVDKCTYLSYDGNDIHGYFSGIEYRDIKNRKYKYFIDMACKSIVSMAIASMVTEAIRYDEKLKLVSIGNESARVIVRDKTNMSIFEQEIVLRVFGRQIVL